jgi:hypothetical protein
MAKGAVVDPVETGGLKEAKVAGVYDSMGICLSCEVVQGGQTPTYVCNTKDAAMERIQYYCLSIYLVDRRPRRDGGR